jgi:hypothetical protein
LYYSTITSLGRLVVKGMIVADAEGVSGATVHATAGANGFGVHLDRLLRAAEEEAAEIRRMAEQAAAALLTQAHIEIDRHEREQRDRWDEREAAVAAAEKRATDEWTAARQAAAALLADTTAQVEDEAQRIRGHAFNRAKEIAEQAEQAAAETTRLAAEEVKRLHEVRDSARAEIVPHSPTTWRSSRVPGHTFRSRGPRRQPPPLLPRCAPRTRPSRAYRGPASSRVRGLRALRRGLCGAQPEEVVDEAEQDVFVEWRRRASQAMSGTWSARPTAAPTSSTV